MSIKISILIYKIYLKHYLKIDGSWSGARSNRPMFNFTSLSCERENKTIVLSNDFFLDKLEGMARPFLAPAEIFFCPFYLFCGVQ